MSRARVMFARRFALTCIAAIGLFAARSAAGQGRAPVYDRVILGVRVIDPESRLDASRNVGITGGSIAIVTASIRRRDTLDAHGLVVAPGFIDLHAHGQTDESYRYYARSPSGR